jgi:hypothetical protein
MARMVVATRIEVGKIHMGNPPPLELFRPNQGRKEVDKEEQRHRRGEERKHGRTSNLLAGTEEEVAEPHEEHAADEENRDPQSKAHRTPFLNSKPFRSKPERGTYRKGYATNDS